MISTTKLCTLGLTIGLSLVACNTDGSDGTEPLATLDSGLDSGAGSGPDLIDDSGLGTTPRTEPVDGGVVSTPASDLLSSDDSTDATSESVGGTTLGQTNSDTTPPSAGSVCVVLDVNGLNPQNRSVIGGAQRAASQFGVSSQIAESRTESDYEGNFDEFVAEGCSLIIGSSVELANAAEAAARRNEQQQFAIVDYDYAARIDNMMELTFNTSESAFLAGYLAAGTTQTGIVATYAGINIEPLTLTMDGFAAGVAFYNQEAGATVSLLGWDGTDGRFVGSLSDAAVGNAIAAEFVALGADTIFPVAGDVGRGTAAYALDSVAPLRVIGVDNDHFETNAEAGSVYLTSIVKNFDVAVVQAIERSIFFGEIGGQVIGSLENGGVDLAPFHEQSSAVSEELREKLDNLRTEVIAGNVATR